MISKEFFLKALSNNKAVRTQDMDLLTAWFDFPERAVTAEQVAEVTGAKRASLIVNNLGKRIASFLEIEPEGTAASILALEGTVGEAPVWIMRDELAAALVESGAVAAAPAEAKPGYEEAEPGSLKAVLIEYDQKVVRAAYPQTPVANRLLNPEMINALISELPANKRVYQRAIPAGLRKKVSTQEANRFLQPILKLLQENA
ncbi:hypothetical protein NX722_02040 [Endozoicomonas gorgoniicola]|uniref:Uncharacterized protein n=1 Tax=Endozoicomonas gorgoniicola TaxID=1234144 RepID=A0ABT3MPZ3_9GAMM|nr:hypothetical protein [Endozoicomonas gorgoniicola]MCW7551441.1 hypothetical protein [Endozoicomonas gorgoniicola]